MSVNAAGTAEKPAGKLVFDCLQLEDGDLANDYNILEDGNFDNPGGSLPDIWKNLKNVALSDEIATEGGIDGKNCYHIKGEPGKNKYLNCTVNLGNKTASYVLSGFIKTNTTPVRNKRELSVKASHDSDNQVLQATLKLDEFSEGWKYFTLILPAHKWGKTTVSINFFDNIGSIYIDGLELKKVNIQSKKFDKEGRVLGTCVSEKQTSYGYDSYDRMNKMVSAGGVTYSYTYDSTNNNTGVKADVGPSTYMTYDKYGNQESVSTHVPITRDEEGNATNKPLELHTSAEYTDDGNFLKSKTDEAGVTTTYEYDTTRGILLSEEQAGYNADVAIEDLDTGIIDKIKNTVSGWFSADDGKNDRIEVAYGYDDDKLISVSKTGDNETRSIDYSYTEGGDIESITHHDFAYTYEYDDFGNLTKTYIAGQEVLTNEYNGNNGSLKYTKYADGKQTYTEYDDYGNIIEAGIKNGEDKLRYDNYEYYNDGNLAHHSDTKAGIETTFVYGDTGKVTKSAVTGSAGDSDCYSRLSYIYNTLGKVENLNIEIKEGDKKKLGSYKYTYAKDGKNAVDTFPDGSSKKFGYDSLRRTASSVYSPKKNADDSKKLYTKVSYVEAEASSKSYKGTQNRVQAYVNYVGNTAGTLDSSFEYTYDDRGNICGIIEEYDVKGTRTVARIGGQYTRGYIYDAFGEVVKAQESYRDGHTKNYYYTYDDGGNITEEVVWDPEAKRDIHNYYEYDPVWKDQLKKYNGKTIDYDKCGNPEKYLDYTMTWDTTNGSLTSVKGAGKNCNYTYLSDGQRISKDVGGEKTAYIYNAGMLLYEETKDYRLNFYYDADGLVTEIGYQTKDNGSYSDETRYFYSRNGQGDIIAVYRCKDSTLVGTYEYDLWGNPVSQNENVFTKKVNGKTVTITDEQGILDKNPLRYRGYYYDKETGFYYLNARYYDPIVHRFISADNASNLGAEGEITSYNLYAYCGNDPINRFDYTGQCWEEVWSILNVAIQQSSGELALAGGIALADSPAIGPADAVSALICGAIILTYCIEELNRRRERIKEGTKAIEISISDAKEQKISNWAAELINKEVYLFESLTLEEARLRVSMLGSIMCISQEAAMLILRLNGYRNAVGPEIHGDEGYFYHYHPTRNHTGYSSVHIWYFS